jgi:hypothetical protein
MMKDSVGNEIKARDIVYCGHAIGWIFGSCDEDKGELWIAWDLVGPSSEDSEPLQKFIDDKYCYVKVVGTLK